MSYAATLLDMRELQELLDSLEPMKRASIERAIGSRATGDYDDGYQDGYRTGRRSGFDDGKKAGHQEGFESGVAEGRRRALTLVEGGAAETSIGEMSVTAGDDTEADGENQSENQGEDAQERKVG